MSRLESSARSVLQPLMEGQRHLLEVADQATLVVWSLKTAMVLEALEPRESRAYSQTEREHLRDMGTAPPRTTVWLAASADPSWFMSSKHRLGGVVGAPSAVTTTMAFAHLAVQIITVRLPPRITPRSRVTTDVRRGPWDQATIRVWPPRSTAANWPPALGLDGELGLDALAERFNTAGSDGVEIDSLEV